MSEIQSPKEWIKSQTETEYVRVEAGIKAIDMQKAIDQEEIDSLRNKLLEAACSFRQVIPDGLPSYFMGSVPLDQCNNYLCFLKVNRIYPHGQGHFCKEVKEACK